MRYIHPECALQVNTMGDVDIFAETKDFNFFAKKKKKKMDG